MTVPLWLHAREPGSCVYHTVWLCQPPSVRYLALSALCNYCLYFLGFACQIAGKPLGIAGLCDA